MGKKRVLILSEGFGSGHTQAGHALAAGIKRLNPDIQAKVIELGSFLNPTVAPWILSAYRMTLYTSPALVGLFYRRKYEKPVSRLTRLALHKLFYQHTSAVIAQLKPGLIVCTHPIPSAIISRLKASGLNIPLCTLITDYDAHGSWISPEVDEFLVSTAEVRELLVRRGVRPSSVKVTGIPVHPEFWTRQNPRSARLELGLKDMPTAFVMGGGWGLLFKEDMIATLAAWREDVQIVCCVGNNAKLAARLQEHPAFRHPHIKLLGFTRDISKWMDASDLIITKPGGMTCTEGLAKGKPMLFYQSISGQEEKNREYFVNNGYGAELASTDILDRWFTAICGREPDASDFLIRKPALIPAMYRPDLCSQNVINLIESSYGQLPIFAQGGTAG